MQRKTPTIAERYAEQIAAVRKVCADIPDAGPVIMDDLLNERRGWYHDLILCYCQDVEPWQWQRIACYIQEEAKTGNDH